MESWDIKTQNDFREEQLKGNTKNSFLFLFWVKILLELWSNFNKNISNMEIIQKIKIEFYFEKIDRQKYFLENKEIKKFIQKVKSFKT